MGDHGATRGNGAWRRQQMRGGSMRRGNASTSQTRGVRGGKGGKGHGLGIMCDKEGHGDSN
jgi:hypothetical protein